MNTESRTRISTGSVEKTADEEGGDSTASGYHSNAVKSTETARNDTATSSTALFAEETAAPITPPPYQRSDSTNFHFGENNVALTSGRSFSEGTGNNFHPGNQWHYAMTPPPQRHSDPEMCCTCGRLSSHCSSLDTWPLAQTSSAATEGAKSAPSNMTGSGGVRNPWDANGYAGLYSGSLPSSFEGTGRMACSVMAPPRSFSSTGSCGTGNTRMRFRSLLQPLSSIHDPGAACAVREQNRNAIIAELERQKESLKRQLAQLRRELSFNNIFSLVRASNASQLQYLLEKKLCNVNERDYNGGTPLHVAAFEGNEAIVRVLVSFGADIMAMDNMGRTPLDWAAANRHSSVCRYLLALTKRNLSVFERQQQRASVSDLLSRSDRNATRICTLSPNGESLPTAYSSTQRRWSPSHLGLPLSTTAAMEYSTEQSNELTSKYVLAALPPDVNAELRSQAVAAVTAVHPLGDDNSSTDPASSQLDDDDDDDDMIHSSEDVYSLSAKFSSYTTVSDTVSLVVCMVGLPGRGKSFICNRISRYLNWKGVPCRVFNAGSYRRQLLGVDGTTDSCFYDPNNARGKQLRDKMADMACEDLMDFIANQHVAVGLFDATNTTRERRRHLIDLFSKAAKQRKVVYRTIFIESICTDEQIITENILRAKCGNDDFKNVTDTSEVINSFRARIAEYEKVYEPLDPSEDLSFIRIINVKHHVILQKIPCGLASRIAFFLLNLHPVAYPIYITLPGETVGDHNHMYGGDERLTSLGEKYAEALKNFILERYVLHMIVLHGTNPSVLNTLRPLSRVLGGDNDDENNKMDEEEHAIPGSIIRQEELLCPLPGLDSINYGQFSGRTAEWVRAKYAQLSRILYTISPGTSVDSMGNFGTSSSSQINHIDDETHEEEEEEEEEEEKQKHGEKAFHRQYFNKGEQAIGRFRHIPDGTDPRLSYCVQFPNGESCRQVNVRLEPALMAVMRVQGPVFVVASAVPAQGVLAFFTDVLPELSPTLRLPRHAVVEIGVKGDITVHQLVESPEDELVAEM
ncbi:putative 6-phosphofructo-2-kinase/fructose-2,6-biphosphatase [Trypanosoma theileri]|uniref:Putative 6-phosphofructo-2-kinase/fructose-2,6-biphosphatase n=1 Tax=Trypanosoma theileri TaxID=67003 RepID=A0A1X0P8W5_9TRYP|nr:putative 6-phosphofructo-2-kinase/fructose-2,6-biphosphatase [Trypanosoma theileri]ORC93374.1 putative 6-phosphofructo-2-kinase/fructose-2,6-biphosphatase [Trypanosoma theileri]